MFAYSTMMSPYSRYGMSYTVTPVRSYTVSMQRGAVVVGCVSLCHTPFSLWPTVHRKYHSKIKFQGHALCTYIIYILLYHWSYYYSQSTVNAFHHRNSCSKYARWMSRFPNLRSSFQNPNAFFIKYILCREKFDQIR